MNSPQRIAIVAALVLAATHASAADYPKSPRTFLENWAKSWQSSDADKMIGFYDSSKETIAVESLGNIRKGPAEIRKMYQGAFDELIFDRVTLTSITHGQEQSVAWATCRYKAEMRLKTDNSQYLLEVRGSFVMKQENGNWKITLEHFSTIPGIPRVRPTD